MADYTQAVLFGPKDGLTTGDPLKLARGTEMDGELAAIATAVATKFDDTDVASLAEVQAETANNRLITPLRLAGWADSNAGIVGDLQALADPNADRLLFWDDSAGAAALLSVGTNLSVSGTTLSAPTATLEAALSHDNLVGFVSNEHIDHSLVSIIAGTGLTGGGTIAASRSLSLDTGNTRNVDHAAVSVLAGTGLSGGGTLAASRTLSLDISGLTQITDVEINDLVAVYDASAAAMRAIEAVNLYNAIGLLPIMKTANETVSSSTTLQNDDHIAAIPLEAGTRYMIEGALIAQVGGTGIDIIYNIAFTDAPQNFVLAGTKAGTSALGTVSEDVATNVSGSGDRVLIDLEAETAVIYVKGFVQANATTGGTATLQWAQSVSNASGVTLQEGSYLRFIPTTV